MHKKSLPNIHEQQATNRKKNRQATCIQITNIVTRAAFSTFDLETETVAVAPEGYHLTNEKFWSDYQ